MERFPKFESCVGKPNPINASTEDPLKESRASRKELCLYTPELQQAKHIGSISLTIIAENTPIDCWSIFVYAFMCFKIGGTTSG
jgi:hypothetical protein